MIDVSYSLTNQSCESSSEDPVLQKTLANFLEIAYTDTHCQMISNMVTITARSQKTRSQETRALCTLKHYHTVVCEQEQQVNDLPKGIDAQLSVSTSFQTV